MKEDVDEDEGSSRSGGSRMNGFGEKKLTPHTR